MVTLATLPFAPRERGWYAHDEGMRLQTGMPFTGQPRVVANRVAIDSPFVVAARCDSRNGSALASLVLALVPMLCAFFLAGPWRRPPWELFAEALRHPSP